METEYRVGAIGTADAGAPHRRERIWILAYANVTECEARSGHGLGKSEPATPSTCPSGQHPIGQLADTDVCGRLHGQVEVGSAEGGVHAQREPEPSGEDVADTDNEGCDYIRVQDRAHSSGCGNSTGQPYKGNSIGGSGDWWATEPGLGGAIDGLATGMVGHWGPGWEDGVPRVATGVPNRVDRLKAIGNGQVPAAAALAWNTLYQRIQR